MFRTDIATEFLKFVFHFLGLKAPCKGERHQTALRLWYRIGKQRFNDMRVFRYNPDYMRTNSCIVVAMLNGEQTVKRFKMYGDNIFLMPENPAFEPIPVLKGADFLILGKVVEVRMAL